MIQLAVMLWQNRLAQRRPGVPLRRYDILRAQYQTSGHRAWLCMVPDTVLRNLKASIDGFKAPDPGGAFRLELPSASTFLREADSELSNSVKRALATIWSFASNMHTACRHKRVAVGATYFHNNIDNLDHVKAINNKLTCRHRCENVAKAKTTYGVERLRARDIRRGSRLTLCALIYHLDLWLKELDILDAIAFLSASSKGEPRRRLHVMRGRLCCRRPCLRSARARCISARSTVTGLTGKWLCSVLTCPCSAYDLGYTGCLVGATAANRTICPIQRTKRSRPVPACDAGLGVFPA